MTGLAIAPRRLAAPFTPSVGFDTPDFSVRLARCAEERDAAFRLRFEVFNLELGEGLAESYARGRDEDAFDAQCDHLLVEERSSGRVVGTYRLQTLEQARAGRGFYTATEFDLSFLPLAVLERGVELGRACVAREHRGRTVLMLLWRGIADYAASHGKRYFFGCCSLPSRDPRDGWRALAELERRGYLWDEATVPGRPGWTCPAPDEDQPRGENGRLTALLESYLRLGGKVCSPPVLDREFGTIDFLTVFDIEAAGTRTRDFFFPQEARRRSA